MLGKLACRLFGHAGPKDAPYKEWKAMPRVSGNASLTRIEWECPRCGENAWALKMRLDPVQRTPAAHRAER